MADRGNVIMAIKRLSLAVLVGGWLLAGCVATQDKALSGEWRVVDPTISPHETVPGAALLFKFIGGDSTFGHSAAVCDGATLAFADPSGKFQWPDTPMNRMVSVVAYKAGYARPREGAILDPSRHEVYLIREHDKSKITQKYDGFMAEAGCINIGDQGGAIADFLELAIPELEANARSPQDFAVLRGMKHEVETTRRLAAKPLGEENRK